MESLQGIIEMLQQFSMIIRKTNLLLLIAIGALSACSPDNEAAQGTPVKERELVKEREVMPFEILHNPQYAIYQSDDLVALNVVDIEGKWAYGANREEFLALDKAGIKKFEDDIIASQENMGGWFLEDCGEEYFCVKEFFVFAISKGEIKSNWSLDTRGNWGLRNIKCKLQNSSMVDGRKLDTIICNNDSNYDKPLLFTYSKKYGVETLQNICTRGCGDRRKYTLISKKGIFATED